MIRQLISMTHNLDTPKALLFPTDTIPDLLTKHYDMCHNHITILFQNYVKSLLV